MKARNPTKPTKLVNEAASTRFALPVNEAGVDEVGEEDPTAGMLAVRLKVLPAAVLPAAVLAGGITTPGVLP